MIIIIKSDALMFYCLPIRYIYGIDMLSKICIKKYHANIALILYAFCVLDLTLFIDRYPAGVSNKHCILSLFYCYIKTLKHNRKHRYAIYLSRVMEKPALCIYAKTKAQISALFSLLLFSLHR